jgi:hypothetical protein
MAVSYAPNGGFLRAKWRFGETNYRYLSSSCTPKLFSAMQIIV